MLVSGFQKNNKFSNKILYKKKNKLKISISNKSFRIYDSIVNRRLKILRRLKVINLYLYKMLFLKYQGLRWLKEVKLMRGFLRYKRELYFLESQGLKRKLKKRRMSNYAVALYDKQKLKNFYIGLTEYSLRNIVRSVFNIRNNHVNVFVSILESRIVNFLFRVGLSSSLFKIKTLLKNGYIKVNNKVVTNINYYLLPGDLVSYTDLLREKVLKNNMSFFSKRISLMYYPSSYIEISFSLLNFLYYRKPNLEDIPFNFNINFNRILSFYNYKGLR